MSDGGALYRSPLGAQADAAGFERAARPFRRALGRSLRRNRLAAFAALVIAVAVFGAALAPRLPLADPDTVDTVKRLQPPLTPGHTLGTDEFGRDLLSRLVW